MIKFFRLSKRAGAFNKGLVNLYSEQARVSRWQKQNQMSCGHLVEIAACGKINMQQL